jgi:SpoVK/Ycf46/Vps4 family AAA+-type ATPase
MSEFAYFRFMSNNMLTIEEQQHKDEIISLTEQVLDAKGIECDSKISKISEEQLREILEEVRRLRKRKKKKMMIEEEQEDGVEDSRQKEEQIDIIAMQ